MTGIKGVTLLLVLAALGLTVMLSACGAPPQTEEPTAASGITIFPIGKTTAPVFGQRVSAFWVCEEHWCHKCVSFNLGYGGGLSCSFDYEPSEMLKNLGFNEEVVDSLFYKP